LSPLPHALYARQRKKASENEGFTAIEQENGDGSFGMHIIRRWRNGSCPAMDLSMPPYAGMPRKNALQVMRRRILSPV